MKSLHIAATGMAAQQTRVEVISNNIANMSTSAYRPRVAEFSDLMYQQVLTPGTITSQTGTVIPSGVQIGTGVRAAAVSMEITQGSLRPTGAQLDIAIDGSGFLQVTLPSGELAYTRDGNLNRSPEGEIVTSDGFPLADNITIPDDAQRISIGRDGEVVAYFDDAVNGEPIGVISLTRFVNEKGLEAMGDNLFRATEASGQPTQLIAGAQGAGEIRQGFLEDSGVDVVKEISDLIEAQRGYELNSKVITASDEMMAATTRLR